MSFNDSKTQFALQVACKNSTDGSLIYNVVNSRSVSGTTETTTNNVVVGGTLAVTGVQTFTGSTTHNGGATVATGQTLAVTDADALTVGAIKVPQQFPIVDYNVPLHASKVIYNLFVVRDPIQVTTIDCVVDIPQGSALTATLVKATGTNTPSAGTTPLHSGTMNLNGVAHTVQTMTLTVTTADLQFASGDRIAVVLSGAMTTGSACIAVRGKRI